MKRRLLPLLLALCLWLPALKAQLNTEQVMIIGRNALYYEDYVLSIQYFNKVVAARPYLHEPYFYRALAKFNLDDYSGAEADLTSSIERNPYVSRSWQLRGLCRANLENYADAESDFRMAIKYDPQNPMLWQNLAVTAIKRHDWTTAAAVIDSMLVFSPRNSDAYIMRSQVAMKQKDTIVAERMIADAVRCDKYSPEVYSARAMLYAETERYEAAENDLDNAIDLMPGEAGNYLNRALVRYYRHNLRGAMADYDMVLYIDPGSFYGHYNRGILRMELGDDNLAIEDFDKVLEIDPDNTPARFNRALLRDKTGDLHGAIDDYSRVLSDYPNFEYGYSRRAAVRRKVGDIKGAERDEVWLLKRMNASLNGMADADTAAVSDDKVRKRSDRNVRNYNKMVVADDEPSRQYANAYRGRVQNRNVYVELQPMIAATYYESPREVEGVPHYYKPLDDLNRIGFLSRPLLLTSDERALSADEVERHFAGINEQSKNTDDFPDEIRYRLARALDFYLVQDFDASINDLDIAYSLDGEVWLVCFVRATVRFKKLESQRVAQSSSAVMGAEHAGSLPNLDYRLVKSDLDMVIAEMPDFAHAYYNRGNVSARLSDFKSAVVDYSKAIELDSEFAEAYYNRGLAHVYLGNTEEGVADLSKAGELGIYSAYSLIKRLKNRE